MNTKIEKSKLFKSDWIIFAKQFLFLASIGLQELQQKKYDKHLNLFDRSFSYEDKNLLIAIIWNLKHAIELILKSLGIAVDKKYLRSHDIDDLVGSVKEKIATLKINKKDKLENLASIIKKYYKCEFWNRKIIKDSFVLDLNNDIFRFPENSAEFLLDRFILKKITPKDIEETGADIKKLNALFGILNSQISESKSKKFMKIYFIGIGGIGVSALARYFLAQENEVSGSDAAESGIVEDLRKMGAKITSPQPSPSKGEGEILPNPSFIKEGADLVIYSAAVREDDPELVEARRLNVKTQKYAQALGVLTKEKFTIAVSGMHGKSTTTAMIGLMMEKAGLDPTVIVGTKVRWGSSDKKSPPAPLLQSGEENYSNCRIGKSKYLLIEADEYDKSILNYWPKILVLLNIEEEHLDTYKGGLPGIMETFGEYISHLPEGGVLVANNEDANIAKLTSVDLKLRVEKYDSENTYGLNLKIPGKHSLSNANAALAVARVLGIDEKIAVEALNDFTGAWRRMEYKGELNGAKIYDDYGHHPTEIKATLEGARSFLSGAGRLWCVFQPHQYHRTYELFDQFTGAFGAADKAIILPIYSVAGREDEEIKQKVNSEKLVEAINNGKKVLYMDDFDKAAEYLKKNLQPGDVCVIMGAGDVYKLTELLFSRKK